MANFLDLRTGPRMSLLILPGNLLLARFGFAAGDLFLAVKLLVMINQYSPMRFGAQIARYHFLPTRNFMHCH